METPFILHFETRKLTYQEQHHIAVRNLLHGNSVITRCNDSSKVMKQLTVVPSHQARPTELHDIYKALSEPPKHMFLG